MYKNLVSLAFLCLLTACFPSTPKPLPPPPPPMPFHAVWAPDDAPALVVPTEEILKTALDSCYGGTLVGKNTKDDIFPGLTFVSKALDNGTSLHAGKLYTLADYTNGTQTTNALMVNLTTTQDGEILECMAEKVIYRSK